MIFSSFEITEHYHYHSIIDFNSIFNVSKQNCANFSFCRLIYYKIIVMGSEVWTYQTKEESTKSLHNWRSGCVTNIQHRCRLKNFLLFKSVENHTKRLVYPYIIQLEN